MQYGLSKPCRECPFLAQMKGWIGGHENAIEFHELVRADVRMPCHMTSNGENEEVKDKKQHHCAGYAMYMNAMCKKSRDHAMANFQDQMRKQPKDNLLFSFDGSKIVQYHHGKKECP